MNLRSTVVIYAHPFPHRSRVNRPLAEALAALPQVQVRDLYRDYTDYNIDIVAEQRALAAADTVVLQFPLRWFSVPPLLKLWLDEVLERGWAYGPGGTALRGKSLLVAATTGGTADSYSPAGAHRHEVEAFLLPLAQTARLCGMNWLAPAVAHDAHHLQADDLSRYIDEVKARLSAEPPAMPVSAPPADSLADSY
ncbi:NAD(P)H-dependent oxidoreductase [Cupriavidus respiraculi]|uniref:glutathione-regulated potassium-efflux system oxidoreductase KefF n=1 Tax=Cupriavidus respiraculi TaxID=195930 RepID=UPI001C980A94|nr:NAD(P)H-dependent oxidoreductase [Cupriavidus respiraculi]MBY4946631.1 NAD(P)H-dependent oxidoreductase [Cupriavidus respiraculi]